MLVMVEAVFAMVMVAKTMREGVSTLPWLPAYYVSLSLDDSSFCHEHSVASTLGLVAAVSFVLALVSIPHVEPYALAGA